MAAKDAAITLTEAEALANEIERLHAENARLRKQVVELDELAHQDPLVGLPNRRSFDERLRQLIARVERYGDKAAMLFVDVDGLKRINDQLGHTAGDEALVQVARMLLESVRKSDCVARIGGDEFAILLERADEASAWEMALRIVETITAAEVRSGTHSVPLSVAVGIGVIQPGDNPQMVIDRADKAMYRVKAA